MRSMRTVLSLAVFHLILMGAPTFAGDRITWEYQGGYIENVQGHVWVERAVWGTCSFVETYRNSDFVEMYDQSRDLYVRLYNDALFFRKSNNPNWSYNKPGRWRKCMLPRLKVWASFFRAQVLGGLRAQAVQVPGRVAPGEQSPGATRPGTPSNSFAFGVMTR